MTYSVQLYSVRQAFAADPAGTLDRLADIGFQRVELFDFVSPVPTFGGSAGPDRTAETFDASSRVGILEAGLAGAGLQAPSGHAPFISGGLPAVLDAAEQLGVHYLIDPFLPAEHWQDLDGIKRTADALNSAAQQAAPRGMVVGYHNHAWEAASMIDGVTGLEQLAGLLEPEVVLEVDTFWATVGGQDPAALLQRLADRVQLIHLKDGPISNDVLSQLPVGSGAMDIPAVLRAATAVQVPVVEFDAYAGDIFEGLARSLAYLNRTEASNAAEASKSIQASKGTEAS